MTCSVPLMMLLVMHQHHLHQPWRLDVLDVFHHSFRRARAKARTTARWLPDEGGEPVAAHTTKFLCHTKRVKVPQQDTMRPCITRTAGRNPCESICCFAVLACDDWADAVLLWPCPRKGLLSVLSNSQKKPVLSYDCNWPLSGRQGTSSGCV